MATLTDEKLLKFIKGHFTDKEVVQYYLQKARFAAHQAQVAIDTANLAALSASAQEMITNIEQINRFLGKDENGVDEKKK